MHVLAAYCGAALCLALHALAKKRLLQRDSNHCFSILCVCYRSVATGVSRSCLAECRTARRNACPRLSIDLLLRCALHCMPLLNSGCCFLFCTALWLCRAELDAAVPWPSTHVLNYKSVTASGVVADSLQWLNWMKDFLLRPAKRSVVLASHTCQTAGMIQRRKHEGIK